MRPPHVVIMGRKHLRAEIGHGISLRGLSSDLPICLSTRLSIYLSRWLAIGRHAFQSKILSADFPGLGLPGGLSLGVAQSLDFVLFLPSASGRLCGCLLVALVRNKTQRVPQGEGKDRQKKIDESKTDRCRHRFSRCHFFCWDLLP